jgi:hypothetical protein
MGTVTVKINLDKTGYSAGITDTRRQAKQLADSLKAAGADGASAIAVAGKGAEQLGKSLKSAGDHGVSSMQAASGAIRLLEGGLQGNIRAAERFIGLIPGLSTGLQAAFPLIGALAFGGAILKITEEASKFITTARDMPRTITAGFESLTLSAHAANDELNVSNDKIENQIAKLEHKPENNLKLALDEAKVSADQFAKSIETAANAMRELISKNSISMVQGFFADTAPTKALAGTIKPFEDDKEHFATQAAIGKSLGDNSRYDQNLQAFHAKEDAELAKMRAVLADAQAKQAAIAGGGRFGVTKVNQDQTPIMTMAQGVIDQIQLSRAHEVSEGTRGKDDARLGADQKAAQMAADAKKAQEQLLKVYEEQERQQNAFNKLTINEEIQFWNDRIGAFTKGSDQYLQVQSKIYEEIAQRPDLTKENKKNQATAGKSQVEGNDLLANAQKALSAIGSEQMERAAKSSQKYYEIVAQGNTIKLKEAQAFQEASVAIGLEQGTISKLAAAQELASIHARDHAGAIAEINRALAEQISLINSQKSSNLITSDDAANATRNAREEAANRVTAADGAYAVTQARDADNVQGNTISGAQKEALSKMVQSFNDLAANLKNIIPHLVDGLNDDLAKLITGHGSKADFGRTLTETGQSLTKVALQRIEGMGLSKLGLGGMGGAKPDGTQNNRFYVSAKMEDGGLAMGGGSAAAGIIASAAKGAPASISTSIPAVSAMLGMKDLVPGGSFIQLFLGSAMNILPHFAGGGDILANHPSIVGENGPELFTPGASGRISPNNQLWGGGDVHHHWNIDARGANDPGGNPRGRQEGRGSSYGRIRAPSTSEAHQDAPREINCNSNQGYLEETREEEKSTRQRTHYR